MDIKMKLIKLCINSLEQKGLKEKKYKLRLQQEMKEVVSQDYFEYFLDLYDTKTKYETNENNLLICYLLDLVPDFDIDSPPKFDYGEFPDIDVDYMPSVRKYLKEEYCIKEFGADRVCNIATYSTFGIRNALIDMAKVLGYDRQEIIILTTALKVKDDEGEVLTWDKAIELYDDLRIYLEARPDLAEAAKKLLHRNKNIGLHPSGLIISGIPLEDFVPLVVPKGSTVPAAAWVEGLQGTDLGAVGLVKFDFLSLDCNAKIFDTLKLVAERHNKTDRMCSLPNGETWSDTSYLNDKKAMDIANSGSLRMIFQFDGSKGIREMSLEGGIECFDDLVAYTALYRPPILKIGMHDKYIARKHGKEEYEIHEKLKPILDKTFGILCYQEQLLQVLNIVGKIPLKDCETIRKAISKKKVEYFSKYKEMFIKNGQEVLNCTMEEITDLWGQVELFAGYGFNLCVSGDTEVCLSNGETITIKEVHQKIDKQKIVVQSLDKNNKLSNKVVKNSYFNGVRETFKLKLTSGQEVIATEHHRFLTDVGWKELKHIEKGDWIAIPRKIKCPQSPYNIEDHEIICLAHLTAEGNTCHPSTLYFYNKDMKLIKDFISKTKQFGKSNIKTTKRKDLYTVSVNSGHKGSYKKYKKPAILEWSEKIGIKNVKATAKILPKEIFNFSKDQIGLLLGRMWDGDGHIEKGNTFYATSSKMLAYQVQSLLLRLDIISVVSLKKFKYRDGYKIGYTVRLIGENWITKFKTTLGKYTISKKKEIMNLKNSDKNYDLIPKKIYENILKEEIKKSGMTRNEISTKSQTAVRLLFNDSKKTGIMRSTLNRLAKILNSEKLKAIANSDIFWSKARSIEPLDTIETYDIEVEDNHNFIANNVISHNSHAVAYTVNSARMLYLKAHYPLEFYTSVLSNTKTAEPKDYAKIKEYKLDMKLRDGIEIQPINLNLSGAGFTIHDNKIYYAFSKIRGIGKESATAIESHQPYKNLFDFMDRYGTESKVVQALIALGAFKDYDKLDIYKYYEAYKDYKKKKNDAKRRYVESQKKRMEQYRLLKESNDLEELKKICSKIKKSEETYKSKLEQNEININIENVKLDKKGQLEFLELLDDKIKAEMEYYGFEWQHPLETCGANLTTIEDVFNGEEDFGAIDLIVEDVQERKSTKNKKLSYYQITGQDVSGNSTKITLWSEDYEKFKAILYNGSMLKIRVQKPKPPFRSFLLEPKSSRLKYTKKVGDWKNDTRIIILNQSNFA